MKTSYLKPLLPLRDIVIFPSMVVPLFVGREKSIKALQEVMKSDKSIVLVTQKNSETDDPSSKDLYQFGCLSKVLQLLKLPDGTVKVLVEGEKRVKILKYNENGNNLYQIGLIDFGIVTFLSNENQNKYCGFTFKYLKNNDIIHQSHSDNPLIPLYISLFKLNCSQIHPFPTSIIPLIDILITTFNYHSVVHV